MIELALHPITLGFGQARSVRGRPLFAEGELGQKILGDITRLSSAMGTKITIRDGVGYVESAEEYVKSMTLAVLSAHQPTQEPR